MLSTDDVESTADEVDEADQSREEYALTFDLPGMKV